MNSDTDKHLVLTSRITDKQRNKNRKK